MSDATILKPRPGGRIGKAEAPVAPVDEDKTRLFSIPSEPKKRVRLPGLGLNPLIDAAGNLLSLVAQIRATKAYSAADSLRQRCIEYVRDYEHQLRREQIDGEQIEAARYCICALLDETVLNTPWGSDSVWSAQSLLSTFHAQTWGGEHFFTLLDNALMQPHTQLQLIELQHLILSLGFVGKMRLEERGHERLEEYRHQSAQALKRHRPELAKQLSAQATQYVVHGEALRMDLPLWVIASIAGFLLLSVYMLFSYHLNQRSDEAFAELNQLVSWAPSEAQSEVDPEMGLRIAQRLQTEVEMGQLELERLPDRLRMVLKNDALFDSGSASVKEAQLPLLGKLARTLEATQGRIVISGHTDNQPIFTSKYPSNWHLSLARANAVANVLARSGQLQGRLWPEGKGDTEPRADNSSSASRRMNRRVEIDLFYP